MTNTTRCPIVLSHSMCLRSPHASEITGTGVQGWRLVMPGCTHVPQSLSRARLHSYSPSVTVVSILEGLVQDKITMIEILKMPKQKYNIVISIDILDINHTRLTKITVFMWQIIYHHNDWMAMVQISAMPSATVTAYFSPEQRPPFQNDHLTGGGFRGVSLYHVWPFFT